MTTVMMKCGCAAQATCSKRDGKIYDPPIPSCVIHDCIELAVAPTLTGRKARCAYFGRTARRSECSKCKNGTWCTCECTSSTDLAFFSFQGEGSREATEICSACKMHKIAHVPGSKACQNFTPQGPLPFDKFYCGCASWD